MRGLLVAVVVIHVGQRKARVSAPPLIDIVQHGIVAAASHGGDAAGRDKRVPPESLLLPTLQGVSPARRRNGRGGGRRGGGDDGVGVVQLGGEGGHAAVAVGAVLR